MLLTAVQILACFISVLTFGSLIHRNEWWIRGLDFPRLQLLSCGVVVLLPLLLLDGHWDNWRYGCTVLLLLAVLYQFRMIVPYTFLWPKQVQRIKADAEKPERQLSLLVSNVLMSNRQYSRLLQQISVYRPDVVLTLESDSQWQQALTEIEADYPYRVAVPLDNFYGMHLYSKLELQDADVRFLLSDDIPSIHTTVLLRSGEKVKLHCLHPEPPSPTEAYESTLRDAELLMVGNDIKERDESCVVIGDLNDVAWSRTTSLFQRISGLLDPRIGRYFLNTFHVKYPLLRWSLDHVFHTNDFGLVRMKRLPDMGSDHFPVFTCLQLCRKLEQQQQSPQSTAEDEEMAEQKIQQGMAEAAQ